MTAFIKVYVLQISRNRETDILEVALPKQVLYSIRFFMMLHRNFWLIMLKCLYAGKVAKY